MSSECCIQFKQLNNIDGSSLVTFNGKTSFEGIANVTIEEIACTSLQFSDAIGGNMQIANVIDSIQINTSKLQVTNSVHIEVAAVISNVKISQNTISCNNNIDFTNGINLHNGTSNYVCFLPGADVQATYIWPEYPGVITPTPEPVSVGPYLTSDSNGLLSWTNTKALFSGGYTVGPYMTCDGKGNMSWDSYDVPAVDGVYTIGPFLSAKFGTGNLKWVKASVTVEIP